MMATTGPKKYPHPDDWLGVRLIIKTLYLDEDKTLDDVMEIMARDHGFHATKKMYNKRLKDWGFSKNFREHEVLAILSTKAARDAIGKKSNFTSAAGKVNLNRMTESYLKRNPNALRRLEAGETGPTLESLGIMCRTPSPDPSAGLRAESTSHSLEELLHLLRIYIDGSYAAGTWLFGKEGQCFSRMGQGSEIKLSNEAILRFYTVRDYDEFSIFEILEPAFRSIEDAVRLEAPHLFNHVLGIFLRTVSVRRPEIGEMLLRHLASYTEFLFRKGHPLHGIWCLLRKLLFCNDVELIKRILDVNVDAHAARTGELSPRLAELMNWRFLILLELHDAEAARFKFRQHILRLRTIQSYKPFVEHVARQHFSRYVIELCGQRRFVEATLAADEGDQFCTDALWWEPWQLGYIKAAEGRPGEAEVHLRTALRLAWISKAPPTTAMQANITSHMEIVLRILGKVNEAVELRQATVWKLLGVRVSLGDVHE